MDVEAIVARIWPGEEPRVEVLGGGITNHNYKVDAAGGPYVLRIAGRDTEALGIDRSVEHEAALAAAAVGVGPEVVVVEPEGYLVTRFIEGSIVPLEQMREPEWIKRVAHALKAVHRGRRCRRGSSRSGWSRTTGRRRSRTAPRFHRATRGRGRSRAGSSERVARSPSGRATTTCSTRTSSTTAVACGSSIGSTPGWGTSSSTSRTSRSTTGSTATAARRSSRPTSASSGRRTSAPSSSCSSCPTSARRCGAWIQGAMSELDFDFGSYAAEHFERMGVTAASPAFVNALDAA